MKRSLQKIYWLGIGMALVISLIAVGMFMFIKIDSTREDLRSVIQVASGWTLASDADLKSMAEDIAAIAPPMRVTFLMSSGLVLADSHEEAAGMDSHADRPEVMQAAAGGTGESLRLSDTQATLALYQARQLSEDLILRLSYPIEEITHLVMYYAVGFVVLFMAAYALQHRSLKRFSRKMEQQLEDVRLLLEGDLPEHRAVFPEFQPAVNNIAYLAGKLNADIQEVRRTMNLRNDFVANASHELRSPLTSIMGFAEMMDEGLADTPQEKQMCISMIRKESERMLGVIEDILLLSRAEKQALPKEQVDVGRVAGEIVQALQPKAARKQISLQLSGSMSVYAAEKSIWEILYNLIDNAIHYGRQGGFVQVRLSGFRLEVEDNGVGIRPQHLPHLFEKFYRADETREMAEGGAGLGLSIVKTLAEQCQAIVSVESEPGRGSCFAVTFPEHAEGGEPCQDAS